MRYKFVYSFQLPTLAESRDYVASFGESLLVTWIGLEARVSRRISDSTGIQVNVNGPNPFDCKCTNAFHYCYVPPLVRRQDHISVHGRTTDDRIDFGQHVHIRSRRNYSLEVNTRISHHTVLRDVIVVVKVQAPHLVGGVDDHIMWNQAKYEMTKKYKQDNYLYYKKLLAKEQS